MCDEKDTPEAADRDKPAVVGERCAEGIRYGHLVLLDPPEKGWTLYEGGGDDAA